METYLDFLNFIEERENIRRKKESDLPRPWTTYPVLSACRITNIDRSHDRGTIELMDFIQDMDLWERLYYMFLYRSCYSSRIFLSQMTGIWFHDLRSIELLFMDILDERKPYFIKSHPCNNRIRTFLSGSVFSVVEEFYKLFPNLKDISIKEAGAEISRLFQKHSGVKELTLGNEIAMDLSALYPGRIYPNSEGYMNSGVIKGLRLIKLNGQRKDKLTALLLYSGLSFPIIEHGLCAWNRYNEYKSYYDQFGEFKKEWLH